MEMMEYDEPNLVEALQRLPEDLRVAFAAACAERLLPAYVAFSTKAGKGNSAALQDLLRRLWEDLAGNPIVEGELQRMIETCMDFMPKEDEGPWITEQAPAENAAAAVCYALRCRQSGESQEAAWSARQAFEALDDYVSESEHIDWSGTDPELRAVAEKRILAHPLVQGELARQRRDLERLIGSGLGDAQEVTGELRARAKAEGPTVFGSAGTSGGRQMIPAGEGGRQGSPGRLRARFLILGTRTRA